MAALNSSLLDGNEQLQIVLSMNFTCQEQIDVVDQCLEVENCVSCCLCVQETTFIEQLVADESHMEGRPPGCLKVMVWHLHLEAPRGSSYPPGWTLTAPLQANLPLRQDT